MYPGARTRGFGRLRAGSVWTLASLFSNGEPGAHFEAYDPASLLARRNQLTWSSQFSNAAWSRANILSVTENADGTGDLVVPDTTATVGHRLTQAVADAGVSNTITVRAKPSGFTYLAVQASGGGIVWFNLATGVVTAGGAATASMTAVAGLPGYYDCVYSDIATGTTLSLYCTNTNSSVNATGDGTSGIYLARAQLEWNTTTASAYQDVTDWNTEYLAAAGSANVGMWQDNAGTTPVTAVEQPVGKWMDWKGAKGAAGNHATQATSGQRPLLSARVNLLTKSEQLDDAAWTKSACTAAITATPAVGRGNPFLRKVVPDAAATTAYLTQAVSPLAPVVVTFVAKAAEYSFVVVRDSAAATVAGFNLSTGAATNGTGVATTTPLGGGQYLCSVTYTASTSQARLHAATSATTNVIASANGTDGVLMGAVDLRTSDDAAKAIPAYQRVNTSTDYDTAGFFDYDRLDGIDDNLTAASGGGGTAGFLYCAAVTPTAGAGAARVLWADTGTNTGYRVQINTSNQLQIDAGNATAFTSVATAVTLPLNETHVVTAWDDGTNLNVQIDNGTVASIARPVVAAGSAGFSLGKSNTASAGYFTGRIYSTTYRQSDCGDARRSKLKSYHGRLAGMTL